MTGPRIVTEDFNVLDGQLPSFQILYDSGFRDIQSLAYERWGVPIAATCKNTSRKDFLFISPELQALLLSTKVIPDAWSDHAMLFATFHGGVRDVPFYSWKSPAMVPWPDDFDPPSWQWPQAHPTEAYKSLWTHLESHAGRWFRQLRRLQSFVRIPCNDRTHDHRTQVWNSICRATGFTPTFCAWWSQSEFRVHGAPDVLPFLPPSQELARTVYASFLLAVRNLEKQLQKHHVHYARVRREQNPMVIFQDIKPATAGSVDLLIKPLVAQVDSVDAASLQVNLVQDVSFDDAQPVYVRGQPIEVLHSEKDALWVSDVSQINAGDTVHQLKCKGTIQDLFAVFRSDWQTRHSNRTLTDRISSLDALWPKLQFSLSPYVLKSRAIRVAAWPKGLHGVEATTLALQTFVNLRSSAMKGLDAAGPGCNPHVHLGLIEPTMTDPHYWAIEQTIRTVRACGDSSHVRDMLVQLVADRINPPRNSVSHTVLDRLQMLGWTVEANGSISDSMGTFDLFVTSFPEVRLRASLAWQQVVAEAVSHRTCFNGLEWADVGETRAFLAMLDPSDAGAFRKLLNGAEYTGDAAKHWNEHSDSSCKYCGCEDSRYHRFWQCDAFREARAAVSGCRVLQSQQDGWCDVFTDGSCFHSSDVQKRVAGFAITQCGPSRTVDSAILVGSGVLPGLLQSAFRAELLAILLAMELAVRDGVRLRLWTDCLSAVHRIHSLQKLAKKRGVNSAHSDLWRRVWSAMRKLGDDRFLITHVPAHRTGPQLDAFEEWTASHNNAVDHAAQCANLHRGTWFAAFYSGHCEQVDVARGISRSVQRGLVAISKAVFRVQQTETVQPVQLDGAGQWIPSADFELCMRLQVSSTLVQRYGFTYVALLHGWLTQAMSVLEDTDDVCWISSYHLFVDWVLATGHTGIQFVEGRWQTDGALSRVLPSCDVDGGLGPLQIF
eukprot:Skav201111  [mRNA]  locus=scaffold185:91068:95178:+ [translate_table: standard]